MFGAVIGDKSDVLVLILDKTMMLLAMSSIIESLAIYSPMIYWLFLRFDLYESAFSSYSEFDLNVALCSSTFL